jgi:hypothetical protein
MPSWRERNRKGGMIDCGDRALDMPKAGVLTGKSSGGIHGQKQSDAFLL